MSGKRLALAWAAVAAISTPAWGQGAEASVSAGSSTFPNRNLGQLGAQGAVSEFLKLENGVRIAGRFTINNYRFLGHEFGYGYDHSGLVFGSQGKVGMAVHQGFYDFLAYALPEGSAFRPFVCGGVGFSTFFPPGTSVSYGNGVTKFGYNYGAGVKVKVSPLFGIRLDVRDYVTGKPFDLPEARGLLHNLEVSAGFSVLF